MTTVLLFHHIQGFTDGVQAFADSLRAGGHTVHTPDLFDGRTFSSIEEGFAFASKEGFEKLGQRGIAAAESLGGSELVYAGISFGAAIAQELTQTRPGARGALLLTSCMPLTEYSETWPVGVPVQIHGMEGDEFFAEDLSAARALVDSTDRAELFVYPGDEHLFMDASLSGYDAEATTLLLERTLAFLAQVERA